MVIKKTIFKVTLYRNNNNKIEFFIALAVFLQYLQISFYQQVFS